MRTADAPVPADAEMPVKVRQQFVAGHHPAGEEMLRHPVARATYLKRIREPRVRENVHEHFPRGLQPSGDAFKQRFPIPHVLEHLHGHHAVVMPLRGKRVHVRRQNAYVFQSAFRRAPFDEGPLRRRIGNAGDPAAWKLLRHPQRQRAPAAAKLQDVFPISNLRALAGKPQHGFFRFSERLASIGIVGGAIFHPRAKYALEKRRRHFVVLRIC